MKSRNLAILLLLACLVVFYQNCGGNFEVMKLAQNGIASSTPDSAATPAPVDTRVQKVDMVMLFGGSATVTMSCDGGDSWPYHSFDPAHINDGDGPYSATGLQYANGLMYRSRGWGGFPGTIEKSSDGIKWDVLKAIPEFLSGFIVSGSNFAFADGGSVWHSADNGATWAHTEIADGVRHLHGLSIDYKGAKRMIYHGENAAIFGSLDGGVNWTRTYFPGAGETSCANAVVSNGAGVLVAVGQTGQACRSTDGGVSWQYTQMIPGYFDTNKVVWSGTEFFAYPSNQNIIFRSKDGVTWSSQEGGFYAFTQSQIFVNSKTKKFYAYAYANTFMQSDDGVIWSKLDAAKQPQTTGGTDYISHVAQGEMTVGSGHPCFKK